MSDQAPVDFGTMFRQARERRGVSLQQVATVTKISARVLEALERNDVSKLPGGIFSRAFVRSYAREVGLDPEMAIERFISEFPDESGKEQMPSAKDAEDIEAFTSGRQVATTILQLLGLSIVVIVVVVFAMNSRSCSKSPVSAPATLAPSASAPAPVPAPVAPVATPPATPQQPPAAEQAVASTPDPARVETPSSPQPPPQRSTDSPSQRAARLEFTIAAQADCWLMVKVDKNVVFERLMRAGERLAYQAENSVTLSAGNAGGLSLTINGKPARPLGATGQVVTTTITLDTIANFLQ